MRKISTLAAVGIGTLVVNVPSFVILSAGVGIGWWAEKDHLLPNEYRWLNYSGLIVGFVLSWFWWSFTVPLWRYWAYQRVEDIQRLKEEAKEVGLIFGTKSIFERTELRSERLVALERKLGNKSCE